MHTWERLGDVGIGSEYDHVWNRFEHEFDFQPRVQKSPVIVEPVPSITYRNMPFEAADPNAWSIPVLPDGDYYIFLSPDFRFGTFGHPWEETICVFGQELLDAFAQHPPQLFREIVRSNGQPV